MRTLILFILLGIVVSCTEKRPATKTSIEVSFGALNSANFPGGVLLHVQEVTTGELLTFKLTTSDSVEIPFGTWTFRVVGFDGPGEMQNPSKCGGGFDQTLDATEATVTILANAGTCSGAEYVAMMTTVGATIAGAQWDSGVWDTAQWGP